MKRIILMAICMFSLCFLLTGCDWTDRVKEMNQENKEKYITQAEKNVNAYLKGKYPDMKYEIMSTFCRQKSHMVIVNDFMPVTYLPDVTVYITTNLNENYSVRTDASKTGTDGVDSCTDNIQYDTITLALEELSRQLFPIDSQNIISTKVYCNEKFFQHKFDGDISRFLYISSIKNKNAKFYMQYFYSDVDIDYNSIPNEKKDILQCFERAVFVDFLTNYNIPNFFIANNEEGALFNRLYPYSLNIESVHKYENGGFSVYKNSVASSHDITYLVPLSFFDKATFESDRLIEIDEWKMAIKDNIGYEGIQPQDVVPITNLYLSKYGYVYFLPKSKFNLNRVDGKYFLLTACENEMNAHMIGESEDMNAMMMDEHLYIGNMDSNTYWQVIFIPNSKINKTPASV